MSQKAMRLLYITQCTTVTLEYKIQHVCIFVLYTICSLLRNGHDLYSDPRQFYLYRFSQNSAFWKNIHRYCMNIYQIKFFLLQIFYHYVHI